MSAHYYVREDGTYYGATFDLLLDDPELTEVENEPPSGMHCWDFKSGGWTISKAKLFEAVGRVRKQREYGGVPFTLQSGENDTIDSDSVSQGKLHSILTQIDKNLRADPSAFKFKSDTIRKVSNAEMETIIKTVLVHVQICFEAEGLVQQKISLGHLTAPDAISQAFDDAYALVKATL